MGYKKSWPDITIIWRFENKLPRFGLIETKASDGSLDDDQKILHAELVYAGYLIEVMKSHDDGMRILKKWGILPPVFSGMF